MNYKNYSWDYFHTSYLKTFNTEVPIYTPSVYREFRGEIFTTFHNKEHPMMDMFSKGQQLLEEPTHENVCHQLAAPALFGA